jgi:hypothetical protein
VKFPKLRNKRLKVGDGLEIPHRRSPHLLYANVDFSAPELSEGGRTLLNFAEVVDWDEDRTLRYLRKHQEEFRNCLEWLSKNSVVDYRGNYPEAEYSEIDFREKWNQEPEVIFLQSHGLDHGGVKLEPSSEGEADFEGLRLDQKNWRDPLDRICWYMLILLSMYGTVFVRRCGYWKCRKFFWPRTVRKQFCTDICRAQQHATDKFVDDPEQFRNDKAKYMRGYNAVRNMRNKAKRQRSELRKS